MEMVLDKDIQEIYLSIEKSIDKLRGKTILITGAAGFLGRYFIFSNDVDRGLRSD